ncbi:MAG: sulfur oxidation c-type cytochrome SoxA [Alphaproteobacteria bacterium]|nr:sulfur oxidation c-type cytochrome SoxA [Alphaproteobacteria bacterium]
MRRIAALLAAVFVASLALAQTPPADPRRSGYADMAPAVRAMQDDDAANPAMLWVAEGRALWSKPEGTAGAACATCHGVAERSMTGVAARYPAWAPAAGAPATLERRVGLCRELHQGRPADAPGEARARLALLAYVALQSRGLPISPPADRRLDDARAAGEALFERRLGQLNLACAHCHSDNDGRRLAGAAIPQAHPTAYPLYRLEWQDLGSLQRRLRNCVVGIRAEPWPADDPHWVALELHLTHRARGMTLEAPGVRP